MMSRICLAALALIASGCKRTDVIAAPVSRGSDIHAWSKDQLDTLSLLCEPDSKAELVAAAGSGSSASRELQCEAMRHLVQLGPEPPVRDLAVTLKGEDALSRSAAREALVRMLQDRDKWCPIEHGYIFGDEPTQVSPAQVALWVLAQYPVPALKHDVERVPADVGERAIALHEYEQVELRRETAALAYIEGLTADINASGFERLVAFVADKYPWPASVGVPSDDDFKQVHTQVVAALIWLDTLVAQHKGDSRFPLQCVQSLKAAVRSGELGNALLRHVDQFDPDIRIAILNVVRDVTPDGATPMLQRIEASDPEPKVREAAALALRFAAEGGYSNLNVNAGSGSP